LQQQQQQQKVDANRSQTRIWPKTSPFSQQASSVSTNSGSYVLTDNKQTPHLQMSMQINPTKQLSHRQLSNFEIGTRMFRRKIDYQLNEINQRLLKIMNVRCKWTQCGQKMVNDVRMLIEKKATLQQRINANKTPLFKQLGYVSENKQQSNSYKQDTTLNYGYYMNFFDL
jgi:hypothetical protein